MPSTDLNVAEYLKSEQHEKLHPEIAAELKILKDPNLLAIIDKELDKRIVGEKNVRKAVFLFTMGRITENAEPTSSNLLVNDESGMGKDWVVSNVLRLYRDWNGNGPIQHKRKISPQVFSYWHRYSENEPFWTWDDKIFYGEDIPIAVVNCDTFKTMASASRGQLNESTIVVNQKAEDIKIMGKPVMILTMATGTLKSEMLRRFPIISLDSSRNQSREIVKRWAKFKMEGKKPEYDPVVVNAIAMLQPVKYSIPFLVAMAESINYDNPIVRTNFSRFCDIIGFSVALHQFQRQKDKDGLLQAQREDYEIGCDVIKAMTSNKWALPLGKKQRTILRTFENLEKPYSVTELLPKLTLKQRQLYRELEKLVEMGLLQRGIEKSKRKDKDGKEYDGREMTVYSLIDIGKFELPTWAEIESSVKTDNNDNTDNTSKVDNIDKNDKTNRTLVKLVNVDIDINDILRYCREKLFIPDFTPDNHVIELGLEQGIIERMGNGYIKV